MRGDDRHPGPGSGAAPRSAPVVGIDLGGTKIMAVVLDPDDGHRCVVRVRADTPRGWDAIVSALASVVDDVDNQLRAGGLPPTEVVGLGAAGLITADGVMRNAPNLHGDDEFDLAGALRRRVGRRVTVDNDATAATLAEWRLGAGRGVRDVVVVALGTGIGAGVVAGGALQRGAWGFAGEAGHMVVDPDGPACPCGRRGCWERYASGSGLAYLAAQAVSAGRLGAVVAAAGGDPAALRGEHVAAAAAGGDRDAVAVVDTFAWWVALGVANVVALLDSQVVVIAGGLVDMGDVLLDPVRRHFADLLMAADHRPRVDIVAAELGADAAAVGAWLAAGDAARAEG